MSNIIDLIIKDSKILSNIGNIAHNSHNNNDDNNSHYDDDDDDDNEDKFSHNKSLTKEEIDEFISKDVIKFYKDKSFKSFSSLIDVINELDNLQSSKLFEALDVLKKNSSYSFLSLPTRLQEYYNYHNIKKYDLAVLFSGDSDFLALVTYLRRAGKKVYIFSSKNNISEELRTGGDNYFDVLKIEEDIWRRELKHRPKS